MMSLTSTFCFCVYSFWRYSNSAAGLLLLLMPRLVLLPLVARCSVVGVRGEAGALFRRTGD